MTASKKINILIVEDDPGILQGLLDVLIFNGYEADGIKNGQEGLSKALSTHYDLIILDVMLPSVDGFTICREVRREKPDQAIIMLTAKGDEDDIVTGFKSGADDYIPKPFSIKELMVRIEAVLRRTGKAQHTEKFSAGGISFNPDLLTASKNDKKIELTRKEMDIITYLHQYKNRIVSKKELLLNVWHYANADIETRTVDIHILKLRKKILSIDKDSTLFPTKRGEGYKLAP